MDKATPNLFKSRCTINQQSSLITVYIEIRGYFVNLNIYTFLSKR